MSATETQTSIVPLLNREQKLVLSAAKDELFWKWLDSYIALGDGSRFFI